MFYLLVGVGVSLLPVVVISSGCSWPSPPLGAAVAGKSADGSRPSAISDPRAQKTSEGS